MSMQRPGNATSPRGGPQYGQSSGGVTASMAMSPEDARKIIVEGDAELLVRHAEELARQIKISKSSRTSVRRLFSEVRLIEMIWRDKARANDARRRSILFRPRLAYQVGRDSTLFKLQQVLEPLLKDVGGDRVRFGHFVEFFEAVVAFLPRASER